VGLGGRAVGPPGPGAPRRGRRRPAHDLRGAARRRLHRLVGGGDPVPHVAGGRPGRADPGVPPGGGGGAGAGAAAGRPARVVTVDPRQWAEALAAWRLPAEITEAVRESPWVLPGEVFARRAERAVAAPGGESYRVAMAALGEGGSVINVGVGGGSASLPLAPRITALTAVDSQQ